MCNTVTSHLNNDQKQDNKFLLMLAAIKSKAERRYVLNSKSKVVQENEVPHFYVNAGALWTYDRRNDIESITSKGPTNSEIYIAVSAILK